MKYIQIIQYFYLIASILFFSDGIYSLIKGDKDPVLPFLLAGLALFMYFFRKRHSNKMK